MISKKRSASFLVLLFVAVFAWWKLRTVHGPMPSGASDAADSGESIPQEKPESTPQAAAAPVPPSDKAASNDRVMVADAEALPAKVPATEDPSPTFENHDGEGRVTNQVSLRRTDALTLLEQKKGLQPDVEFEALGKPNFNDVGTAMLSGRFLEPKTGLELDLGWVNESGETAGCFYDSAFGLQRADGKGLEFRSDGGGYGALAIGHSAIIRLSYFMSAGPRTLVGDIYRESGGRWSLFRHFEATEVPKEQEKALVHCSAPIQRQ